MPPTELLIQAFLYGALIPAVVTAALLVVPLWLRPELAEPTVRRLGALATAAGFVAGCFALGLVPLRPGPEAWHWLPWLALVAAAVTGAPLPGLLRAVLWLGVAALAAWWLVPATLFEDKEWAPLRERCYLAVAGGVLALGLLVPLARRRPGPLVPLLWALAVGAGAFVLERSANAKLAQLAGALAAALGAVTLAAVLAPWRPVAHGAVAVAAALLPGFMAEGKFYTFGEVPLTSFVLAAVAPLGLLVAELPGLRSLPARGQSAVRTLAVLVPLAVAVALAIRAAPAEEDWAAAAGRTRIGSALHPWCLPH
jgi:hypothetical protein